MDTYAADVASSSNALDLKNAIHVGHSTGGGEVAHYVARAEPGRVAKAVLIGAVPPVMVKTDEPGRHADRGVRRVSARRSRPTAPSSTSISRPGPFYGFNRPGAKVSEGMIRNWWRQGMMGGIKAALRVHQGLLRNRLHRGPEEDRGAGAGDARRGRPDRALCGFRRRSRPSC